MECNRDEALRAQKIAEKKFSENDFNGAKKFILKAKNLYPKLEGISQILLTLEIHICAEVYKTQGETNWYVVLGESPLADEASLRRKYKKLAILLHPDKNRFMGAKEAFQLISQACDVLLNKSNRLDYDTYHRDIFGKEVETNPIYTKVQYACERVEQEIRWNGLEHELGRLTAEKEEWLKQKSTLENELRSERNERRRVEANVEERTRKAEAAKKEVGARLETVMSELMNERCRCNIQRNKVSDLNDMVKRLEADKKREVEDAKAAKKDLEERLEKVKSELMDERHQCNAQRHKASNLEDKVERLEADTKREVQEAWDAKKEVEGRLEKVESELKDECSRCDIQRNRISNLEDMVKRLEADKKREVQEARDKERELILTGIEELPLGQALLAKAMHRAFSSPIPNPNPYPYRKPLQGKMIQWAPKKTYSKKVQSQRLKPFFWPPLLYSF